MKIDFRTKKMCHSEHEHLAGFIGSKLAETDGYSLSERIEEKIEQYKQGGVELTKEQALEEIIADSMFRVFENEQYVQDLMEQHKTLGEKIKGKLKNFVQELKQLAKNLKSPEARAMAKQEADTVEQMTELFNNAAVLANAKRQMQQMQEQGQEGAQLSIKELEDGTKYVEVDTDQEEFDGVSMKDMPKFLERYMTKKYRGMVIGEGENRAYVDRKTAKEYAHPAKHGQATEIYEAKARAAAELDNLMRASELISHTADDGRHADAKGGWNHRTVVFKVGKLFCFGEINTMLLNEDGTRERLHDITKIEAHSALQGRNAPLAAYGLYKSRIALENAPVNTQFQMKEEVEQVKDLIAVHNRSIDALIRDIKRGGMAAPSIAVTKLKFNYTNFGEVSILFNKSSIDPQANEKNSVYGADAWTPREPYVERKVDYDPKGIRKIERWLSMSDEYEREFRDGLAGFIDDWGTPGPDKLAEYLALKSSAREAYVDKKGTTEEQSLMLDGKIYYVNNLKGRTEEWIKEELNKIATDSYMEVTNEKGEKERKPYTIENIITEMFKGGKKRGVRADFAQEIGAVSATEYKTLDELKADSGRFNVRDMKQQLAITSAMEKKAMELAVKVANENGINIRDVHDNQTLNNALIEAAGQEAKTAESVKKTLEGYGLTVADEVAEELGNLFKEAAADDVSYMEAKPERGVYTDEWSLVVLPANKEKSAQAMRDMDEAGISYVTYDGTDADRIRIMNEEAQKRGLVFSLKEYTDHELENWKGSKDIEVYTDRMQGRNFINRALTDNSFRKKLYFGKIDEGLAAAIKEATGLDVEGYNLALHADEVRKIAEFHGNEESENRRGQSAITAEDLLNIPETVKNATDIQPGEYNGNDAIIFVREQGNKTTTVTYVANKKHDLRVQTMYKSNKKRGLSTAFSVQAENFTSETDPRYSPSDVNLAQEKGNVKNQFSIKEDTGVLASLQGVDKINENMRQQIEDSEDFREVVRKEAAITKVLQCRNSLLASYSLYKSRIILEMFLSISISDERGRGTGQGSDCGA